MQSGDVTGTVRFRVVAGVVAVAGVAVAWVMGARLLAEPEEAGVPVVVATPSVVASEVEASPSEIVSVEPSPSEVASEEAHVPVGQTVLFRGGPATGPWQQIGSVAEITHPDAPASARFSYSRYWADPDSANQGPELWDQIVREVAAKMVSLGEPLERPGFGGAPGSEPFNSFAGVQESYPDDDAFLAAFMAQFETAGRVGLAFFWYAADYEGVVLARSGPQTYWEDDYADLDAVYADNVIAMRNWMTEEGFGRCGRC